MSETHCQHGSPFYGPDTQCTECQIEWYRDCLADAERRVESCREKISELENAMPPVGPPTDKLMPGD